MSRKKRTILYSAVIVIALSLIVGGGVLALRAFHEFESTVIDEKDSQLYSASKTADVGINSTVSAFKRECSNAFEGTRVEQLQDEWLEAAGKGEEAEGDLQDVADAMSVRLDRTALANDPLVFQVTVRHGDTSIYRMSSNGKYTDVGDAIADNLWLSTDEEGNYYLKYRYEGSNDFVYTAVLSIGMMYNDISGSNADISDGVILRNAISGITIAVTAGEIHALNSEEADENVKNEVTFLQECAESGESGSTTLSVDESGKDEAESIHVYVLAGDKRENEIFDIAVATGYKEAISPTASAARNMVIYMAVVVVGVALLLIVLVLMMRMNRKSDIELDSLRSKNRAMEELNSKMQALAHHQRLETVGTMTASLAHDLNNILTPIMGYSMLSMEMVPEQSDIYDNMLEVYNASVKAKDIVSRLTELSRKGKEENFKVVSPDDIIDGAIKTTIPAKPKTVKVHAEYGCKKALIRCDATQIAQMVINIVLNAYDAMRDGDGDKIDITTDTEFGEVVIRIKDNGPGMDTTTQAKIFDPFYTTKESGKGTGLGLAIVAQIVETHGGKIYVDSELGRGTEFRITFPVVED